METLMMFVVLASLVVWVGCLPASLFHALRRTGKTGRFLKYGVVAFCVFVVALFAFPDTAPTPDDPLPVESLATAEYVEDKTGVTAAEPPESVDRKETTSEPVTAPVKPPAEQAAEQESEGEDSSQEATDPPATQPPPSTVEEQKKTDTVTVYITRTGTKYHADGCRHLAKSKIPISLDDAKRRGYEPCSGCRPPR